MDDRKSAQVLPVSRVLLWELGLLTVVPPIQLMANPFQGLEPKLDLTREGSRKTSYGC